MAHLADTNVAVRRFLPKDVQYATVRSATDELLRRGEVLCVTPQILIVASALVTRPTEANGLGMPPVQARNLRERIESDLHLLPETADIYLLWKQLVDKYDVIGRQVYDARLVAVMLAHGIDHLLTLNPAHFRRFTEITVHTPEEILSLP